jgi:hypothetical protein
MNATSTLAGTAPYGMVAEFVNEEEILHAAQAAFDRGFRRMEAYTPLPVHGLAEIIGFKDNRLQWLIFLGGLGGAVGGYLLEYWVSAIDYPLNVGGRPLQSWPQFIPVAFECTILLASLTAVFGMFALNGLPLPNHPIFNAKRFELASQDRYFLCIEAADPLFDTASTAEFLRGLGPQDVSIVEHDQP